jgi:Flp pilus assembly protein TadD
MTTLLSNRLTMLAAASAMAFAFGAPTYAAGSDSGNTPTATQTTTKCTDGKIWDKSKKKCIKPQKNSMNDTELFEAARELAYAGQYDNAIKVLQVANNQNDPRILNYMGFANRKAGRVDVAMTYYRKAIAIDANYLLARSYMGQGLILQGDLQGARTQLVEIRDRGGKDTYAYRALYDALKHGSTY